MKTNFDISLPSIPGKSIKFKIQDIKSAAFGSQKARFPDKKSGLTKKFIDSFTNFHPMEDKQEQMQTQPQTEIGRSNITEKTDTQFRTMVAEHKKYLLPIYNDFRKTEMEKQITGQTQFNGGFTFKKSPKKSVDFVETQSVKTKLTETQFLTDNYYFTTADKKPTVEAPKKSKPSAIFKNQTRQRVQSRVLNSTVPGPGAYVKEKAKKKEKQKGKLIKSPNKDFDYKHLKEVITKIVMEVPEEEEEQGGQTNKKNSHMFIVDDRDRFGNQIYPIAPKLNVPGPGSYGVNDSIEDRAKKVVIVEEQRKLLKEWFNN